MKTKGVDAMVEGRLGNYEHAGVDHLYGDGNRIRLVACTSVVHASTQQQAPTDVLWIGGMTVGSA
jgi:hypothetical protein